MWLTHCTSHSGRTTVADLHAPCNQARSKHLLHHFKLHSSPSSFLQACGSIRDIVSCNGRRPCTEEELIIQTLKSILDRA